MTDPTSTRAWRQDRLERPVRRRHRPGPAGLRRVVSGGLLLLSTTALGSGLGLFAWTRAAGADNYGPTAQCTLSVSPTAVYAGQSFTLTVAVGPGSLGAPTTAPVFISGSTVPLGTVTVPTTGSNSASFTLPVTAGPGVHTITVEACSATLAAGVTVQPSSSPGTSSNTVAPQTAVPAQAAAPAGTPSLPFTGADLAATIGAAAAALGAGGALLLLSRRRRTGT